MSQGANETSIYVRTDGKNLVIAYVLWFFLGMFGIHRFYLERYGTGIAQLVLFIASFVTFGLTAAILGLWWLIDAALIPMIVSDTNRSRGTDGSVRLVNTGGRASSGKNDKAADELAQLERLHSLRERGVITEDEYQERRQRVIDAHHPGG